jgi:hypothetical protein
MATARAARSLYGNGSCLLCATEVVIRGVDEWWWVEVSLACLFIHSHAVIVSARGGPGPRWVESVTTHGLD